MLLLLSACTGFTVNDQGTDVTDDSAPVVSDFDCDGAYDDSLPEGPDCLSGVLQCGDVVEGTTRGGSSQLTRDFYESAYCFVPYNAYDGPERVYELELEANTTATVTLEAPCGDLGFGAARWSDTETCPAEEGHAILDCNGQPSDTVGDTKDAEFWAEDDTRFIISVDGDEPAAFRLTVECRSGT